MKHFTVFVLLFAIACEPEQDEYDGPVFLETPDVSDPKSNIEVCDEESGLCWSHPFSEHEVQGIYSPLSECPGGQVVNQVTGEVYDGTDALNSICKSIGMRLATPEEFSYALKKCSVFEYDQCKNGDLNCPESEMICGMRCTDESKWYYPTSGDPIKSYVLTDTCNTVFSCDTPTGSDSWFRCVKPID